LLTFARKRERRARVLSVRTKNPQLTQLQETGFVLLAIARCGVVRWCVWTVVKLAPLDQPGSEGASDSLLGAMAIVG